jgi:2-oxo-3-hexenedioate decarboxylase
VLGSPVRALMHLRDVLATQPWAPPLAAGEIVTTGTITDASPAIPGERWASDWGILDFHSLTVYID